MSRVLILVAESPYICRFPIFTSFCADRCISVFELLVGKLRAAAASASSSDSSARKQAELCNEKIGSLETEVSRLKLLLHSRDGELQTALEEVRASREIAAAAKGKEVNDVPAKDLQSLRDDLAAAQSLAAAAAVERDAVKKREFDLLQQFEELKRAFHDATEGAAAAAKVAPELVEKLKKDIETARLNEMSTRGELCLLKEQLELQEQKLQTLQTQLQAEKQRGERLRREKEDLELANSCMKGEMSTMKRVTVNQDRRVGREMNLDLFFFSCSVLLARYDALGNLFCQL
jgi:hypothetical protein